MSIRCVGVVCLVLLTAIPSWAVDARELAGSYVIKGATADGKNKYETTATIIFKRGNVVELSYKDGKQTWIGVGKLDGNALKFTVEKAVGKGRTNTWEYDVKKNGHIVAEWKDGKQMWKETWVKQK